MNKSVMYYGLIQTLVLGSNIAMKNNILIILTIFIIISCKPREFSKGNVSIVDNKTHYRILIDYRENQDYRATGEILGEAILNVIPNYEELVDSYLYEMTRRQYPSYLHQADNLAQNIPGDYYEEMLGIASNFTGVESVQNDGKLSVKEYILFNILADVIPRVMGCSFIGVNSEASTTGDTILSRNLEWFSGKANQLGQLHAITEFIRDDINTVSIGYAGIMGIVSGANSENIFTGILDSPIKKYPSRGKNSYMMEIRRALENSETLDEMVWYVTDDKEYMRSFLLALSDNSDSVVLENYQRSSESGGLISAVREWNSDLNYANWEVENTIAAVNSFLLPDLPDNHFYKHNTKRLETINSRLKGKADRINLSDLKGIATNKSSSYDIPFSDGDIYSAFSQQIILYRPETFTGEIFFYPKSSKRVPKNPSFETIELFTTLP